MKTKKGKNILLKLWTGGYRVKLRLVPKSQIKKAYEREYRENKLDIKDGLELDSIDRVPEELFLILSETLSFIEKVDKGEEENENK